MSALNQNAMLVDTSASYSTSRLLQELSPLFDITSSLLALGIASASLAIVVVVMRGILSFGDHDDKLADTLGGVFKVLVFVAILACLGSLASWVATGLDASPFVLSTLSKVS